MAEHARRRGRAPDRPPGSSAHPHGSTILVAGLTPAEEHTVHDLAVLLGLEVSHARATDGWTGTVLVGDAGDWRAWEGGGARVVRLGRHGALRLPEEKDMLAQVLATCVQDARDGDRPRALVVGVAGVHGGAGTTTVARGLATRRGGGGILVDAQGPGPGVWAAPRGEAAGPGPGIGWSDLWAGESRHRTDLVTHLPVSAGVAVLGPDAHGWAHADDPRMTGVLRALRGAGDVVVDLGRWDGRCRAGLPAGGVVDVVCLVGSGDAMSAQGLVASTRAHPVGPPLVLVHTSRCASFAWQECAREAGTPGGTSLRMRVRAGRVASGMGCRRREPDAVWEALRAASLSAWIAGGEVGTWDGIR